MACRGSATACGVLDRSRLNFEPGVDRQRRERAMEGGASNGFVGRATLGW